MSGATWLFDVSNYPPRWKCGNWSPPIGWLHIVSDGLIFVAYTSIPVALAVILLRRRDVPFPWVLRLFAAFILSCGITHALDAVMFYYPMYGLLGVAKAITAAVSLVAAAVLIASLPRLIALRTIRAENVALTERLGEMRTVTDELEHERAHREAHSAQLTLKWRRVLSALQATGGVACRWTAGRDGFDWEVGLMECTQRAGLGMHPAPDWRSLVGAEADRLHEVAARHVAEGTSFDFDAAIAGAPHIELRLRAAPEPAVRGQAPTLIGYFRLWSGEDGGWSSRIT